MACVCIGSASLPTAAAAQAPTPAEQVLGSLLSVGGYAFTQGRAIRALGTPKFFGDSLLYGKPAHRGGWIYRGGIELMGASDHFLPFSGGNSADLIGPSFRVTTAQVTGRLQPFAGAGLYYFSVHSDREKFNSAGIVPGLSFGVRYPVAKFVTLEAAYHINGTIGGLGSDGFALTLNVF